MNIDKKDTQLSNIEVSQERYDLEGNAQIN